MNKPNPKFTSKLPAIKRPKVLKKRQAPEERAAEAFANVPRITNETVAEHREDVLGSARKYIYPLKHSRRRGLTISISLFVAALVIFVSYSAIELYKFQSTSTFVYDVSQVIPFPVARAGSSWVSYDSYLFELRHYMHYYATQQGVDFRSASGKAQLANYKKQALQQVISDAYVKQLASKHHVKVSDQAVNSEVALVRQQNRLGSSQQEFDEVLSEFWGWDEADFKRELKGQLLQQAVVAKLDTATQARAAAALQQLQAGSDFGTLAGQVSDDASTKGNGGQYPGPLSQSDPSIAPQITAELFKLQANQISGIINTGYDLEIVKVIAIQGGKVQAAHIAFNFQPITAYTAPLQKAHPSHNYIKA